MAHELREEYHLMTSTARALLKRQIELSVSPSVSEARRSFQSVASNGQERARDSINTKSKQNFFISSASQIPARLTERSDHVHSIARGYSLGD
uniref:SFRICE_017901 n=1 Tax=Spodoptera frugiperda TaxID=7108 RepID=A0A2H1WLX1_SPOFR